MSLPEENFGKWVIFGGGEENSKFWKEFLTLYEMAEAAKEEKKNC